MLCADASGAERSVCACRRQASSTEVCWTVFEIWVAECMLIFFFSSRRRHTRFDCDWSSDVCSSDLEFRESLLMSDLCPVDGMPLIWIARLLGIPLRKRVSGSDIFDALGSTGTLGRKLKVYLFGGAEGVAETVGEKLNQQEGGLTCVGVLNPGFGSVADMSSEPIFQSINASQADLLTV